jgi:D-lactate dehydrogenase
LLPWKAGEARHAGATRQTIANVQRLMKIAFFDIHRFEREPFERANATRELPITFLEPRLTSQTVDLARGFEVVCSFVNDRIDTNVVAALRSGGTRLVALRCAGYNHVDLAAAASAGLRVVRVPEYSPHAVAEHAVALVLALNRKIHRAHARVREGNFSLDGLVGYDLFGKTVGVVGTGRIGAAAAAIFRGFGCTVLLCDQTPNPALSQRLDARYVSLDELYRTSELISLHVPLTPATRHLVDDEAIRTMKPGVTIINTGRGALIDSRALVRGLKTGHVGAAGLDVYEEEEGIFFRDLSDLVLHDDVLARLLTFPNVLVTAHQGFLTREALDNIAETTLENVRAFARGDPLVNEVRPEDVLRDAS